jgi:hypothetical protein
MSQFMINSMFPQLGNPKKRALEDEEFGMAGFGEHRAVRLRYLLPRSMLILLRNVKWLHCPTEPPQDKAARYPPRLAARSILRNLLLQ